MTIPADTLVASKIAEEVPNAIMCPKNMSVQKLQKEHCSKQWRDGHLLLDFALSTHSASTGATNAAPVFF